MNPLPLVLAVSAPALVEELAITVAAAAIAEYIAQRIGLELSRNLLKKMGSLMFGGGAGDIFWATLRALILIGLVVVLTKWVIPSILDTVARRVRGWFGRSSRAPPRTGDRVILAFQALFAAIFFTSIGMLLDLSSVVDLWLVVLVFCAVVVVLKVVTTGVAAALFRKPLPVVAASGFVLAQIGEFSFILEKIGRENGLTPMGRGEDGSQVFIAVTVILIALTPALFAIGRSAHIRYTAAADT